VLGALFEGSLKVAALIDLARRPPAQISGSKRNWVTAVLLVNSAGAVPIAYFRFGRRSPAAPGA